MRDNPSRQRDGDNMKRLRRIVWNGLAVVSALVCAGTVILWIESHGHGLWLEWYGTSHELVMASQNGMTKVAHTRPMSGFITSRA
jgi:hypothetical protein